jgi:hypothetical protein
MSNNTGITLVDVRNEAMDAIQKLKNKEIDVSTAKEIKGLLDTIINTAKTQVDFMNAIPKQVKDNMTNDQVLAIAGTLRDRDAEMDEVMTEIEKKSKEPYKVSE